MPRSPLEEDVELIPLIEPEEQPVDELLEELLPVPDEDAQQELHDTIVSDHEAAILDRSDWEHNLASWEDQYLGRLPEKSFPWPGCANFNVPLTMLGVETLKPRLVEAILGSDPIAYAVPTEATDEEMAQRTELFLNWQLRTELNLAGLVEESAHIFLNPGIVVAKVLWRTEIRRVKALRKFPLSLPIDQVWEQLFGLDIPEEWEQIPGEKLSWEGKVVDPSGLERKIKARLQITDREIQVLLDKEALYRDQPEITLLAPEDFVVPFKGGADVQRLPWCHQSLYYTEDELRRKVQQGRFYKKAIEELLGDAPSGDTDTAIDATEIKDLRAETEGVSTDPGSSVKQDQYPVIESYRVWDIDEDGFEEEVVVWVSPQLEGKILGWDYLDNICAHGKRPFVVGRYLPLPQRFYPLSFPEVVRDIQDEINAIHNQRVDSGTLANTPHGYFRASMTQRPDTMKVKPGTWIPIDNPATDIKEAAYNVNPSFGQNEESLLYQYFERLTGLTDLALGRQPNRVGATRTASGTAALLSEAGLRFKTTMEGFQRFWVDIFQHVLALDQQYLPPGKEFRVTGRSPEIIRVEDRQQIAGRYDLRLSATSETMNKQVLREDATAKLNMLLNPIGLQLGIVGAKGIQRIYNQYLRAYGEQDPSMTLEPLRQEVVHTPEQELAIWASGGDVEPSMLENIPQHLESHMAQRQDPNVMNTPGMVAKIDKHLAKTMQNAQMQAMVNQQQGAGGKSEAGPGGKPVAGEQAMNAQVGKTAGGAPGQAGAAAGGVPA